MMPESLTIPSAAGRHLVFASPLTEEERADESFDAAVPNGRGYVREVDFIICVPPVGGEFARIDRRQAMELARFLLMCASEMDN